MRASPRGLAGSAFRQRIQHQAGGNGFINDNGIFRQIMADGFTDLRCCQATTGSIRALRLLQRRRCTVGVQYLRKFMLSQMLLVFTVFVMA